MNIRKLAEIAEVSPATVSNVLNNKGGVSAETRQRVLALARKHNYGISKQNRTANNILFLKYLKHGMIVEDNPGFISSIMDSIGDYCKTHNYNMIVEVAQNDLQDVLTHIEYKNYAGMIFLGTELDESQYDLLKSIPLPFVVIDNIMPHFNCCSIAIDNEEIVYRALKYLKSLGHNEIAYFKSDIAIQNFNERSEAFFKYIKEFEFTFTPENLFSVTPTLLGSYEDMSHLLKNRKTLPCCAFADNDTIAIGVSKALHKKGFRVPEDISIVGFDDIPFAAIHSPSLTTMRVPRKLIGSLALETLHTAIENKPDAVYKTRVSGELVVRSSTRSS